MFWGFCWAGCKMTMQGSFLSGLKCTYSDSLTDILCETMQLHANFLSHFKVLLQWPPLKCSQGGRTDPYVVSSFQETERKKLLYWLFPLSYIYINILLQEPGILTPASVACILEIRRPVYKARVHVASSPGPSWGRGKSAWWHPCYCGVDNDVIMYVLLVCG